MEPKTRLERFLAAIAGDDVSLDLPKTRIEKYLARILARVSQGGSSGGLPAVTSADNGKVLAVKDGAWAADTNLFVVTYNGSTADKTYSEITTAIADGKNVIFVFGSGTFTYAYLVSNTVYFWGIEGGNNPYIRTYSVNSSNSVNTSKKYILANVTSSDSGSEMIVNSSGVWAKQKKKFIVTLTPTAADHSGTMDKTVAEINAAYEAGQDIWFKVLTGATAYVEVPVSFLGKDTSFDYPNFGAEIVKSDANLMIVAQTLDTSDGAKATYSTKIYALTPAS